VHRTRGRVDALSETLTADDPASAETFEGVLQPRLRIGVRNSRVL